MILQYAKRCTQAATLVVFLAVAASAQITYLQPQGLLNDYANKLNPATRQRLETQLQEFRSQHDIEVAVITIPFPELKNRPIEQYTRELATIWKDNLGHTNLRILLLVAIKNRNRDGSYGGATRLEVNRNFEAVVSNEQAGEIIQRMREDLKAGRFDNAVSKGVEDILAALGKWYGFSPSYNDRVQQGSASPGPPAPPSANSTPPNSYPQRFANSQNQPAQNDGGLFSNAIPVIIGFPLFMFLLLAFYLVRTASRIRNGHSNQNHYGTSSQVWLSGQHDSYRQDSTSQSSWTGSNHAAGFSDWSSSSSSSDSSGSVWTDSSTGSSDSGSSWSDSSSSSSSSSSSDSGSFSGGGSSDSW
jgi:uncharacterized membrane protein YgcG